MACTVKIELLDPPSGAVISSVEGKGVLTDAYKYLSTCGYPSSTPSDWARRVFTDPDYSAGGLCCFEEAVLDDSPSRNLELPLAKKTAFASNKTNKSSSYSKRAGVYMQDKSSKDYNTFTKVWEFDTDEGNGKISSVALTCVGGANAYDKEFTEQELSAGLRDNADFVAYGGPPSSNGLWGYSFDRPIVVFRPRFYDFCRNDRGCNAFYETPSGKIVFLGFNFNAGYGPGGGRLTEAVYRIVDKKWLYHFPFGVNLAVSGTNKKSLSPLDLYGPTDDIIDGRLSFETPETVNIYNLDRVFYEGNSCVVLSARAGNTREASVVPNPDGIDYFEDGSFNAGRTVSAFISGETPTVEMFDSVYASPLWLEANGGQQWGVKEGMCFLKNKSYIYYCADNGHPYLACRYLENDTLVWYQSLADDTGRVNNVSDGEHCIIVPSFAPDCFAYPYRQNGSSDNTKRIWQIREIDRPWVVRGYASYVYKSMNTRMIGMYDDSPVGVNHVDGDANQISIKSGYAFTKATLSTPITKTSAHRMRVTVTVTLDY